MARKINLNEICKDHKVRICSYSDAPDAVKKIGIDQSKTPGVAFKMSNGQPVILFDSSLTDLEVRFTAAHELGHILLGHLERRSSAKDAYPAYAELEANCFAAAFLVYDLICQYGQAN